ncbi:putative transcription factor interactor and regulator CCHC(Zn) family [Helianthus anomalus]
MSLPIPQTATINTIVVPALVQQHPQPQHANVAFSPAAASSSQNIPSTPSVENMAFLTKQNKEKLALATSMINSLNALLAGMAAFKAEKFTKRYGRCPMTNFRTRSLKDKLRCYTCYEPRHFARDCKKAPVGYEATQAAAARNSERSMVPVTPAETSIGQGNSRAGRALIAQEQHGFNWADVVAHVESMKLSEAVEKIHQCLMAQTEELRSLSETVNSLLCSGHCRKKIALMRSHNFVLITDYNSAMAKCIILRENHKSLNEKIDSLKKDIAQHHLEVNQQKCCDSMRVELELLTGKYKQNELNIKKIDTSSDTVRDLCNVQLAFKDNKGKDLGYKQVPPPYNHSYSRMPTTEQEKENYNKMIYGKPSDYVPLEPLKPKNAKPTYFQKPMNFVKNEDKNCTNESAGESEQENETEPKPVKTSIKEPKENLSNSDSVDNSNCSSSCAKSVKIEEKSKVEYEPHSSVAYYVSLCDKHDLYVWNYVFSWFAETRGFPENISNDVAKTKNLDDVVLNSCEDNDLTKKSNALTAKIETPVSSDSEVCLNSGTRYHFGD